MVQPVLVIRLPGGPVQVPHLNVGGPQIFRTNPGPKKLFIGQFSSLFCRFFKARLREGLLKF